MTTNKKTARLIVEVGSRRGELVAHAYRYEGEEPTIRIESAHFRAFLRLSNRIGFSLGTRTAAGRGFTLDIRAHWGVPHRLYLFGRRIETTIGLWPDNGTQAWDWKHNVWTERWRWITTNPTNHRDLAEKVTR